MDYDTRLIEEVKQHPELYDNTHHNFKNNELKYAIWSQIAYQLRQDRDLQTVKSVKMRWKSLRDSYVKEMKHKNQVNGGDIKPRKNWRYSDTMSFLAPFIGPPNPAKGIRRKKIIFQHPAYIEEIEPMENFFITSEDLREVSEDNNNEPVLSEYVDNPLDNQLEMSPDDYQGDEIDSFFKGIADTVKKLSPVNQVKIQRDIVNMVLDVKLREIEESKNPLETR